MKIDVNVNIMWLNENDVHNAWSNFKGIMGNVWHHGQKALGTIDRFANVGMRLLGAAASSGLVKGRALESGLNVARKYDEVRGKAERFGRDVDKTVGHFRAAVPELNL